MKKFLIILCCLALASCWVSRAFPARSFLPFYRGEGGHFVLDRTIGGDIDDPDDFFYRSTAIALDAHGNLFVLDYKGYCIKKFDPEGTYLLTFGGKGEGPGEMLGAYSMAVDPGGDILIFDSMNGNRFSYFDNQGVFLRSVSLTEFGYRNITDFAFGPRGNLYARIRTFDFMRSNGVSLISIARLDLESKREWTVDSLNVRDTYIRNQDKNWEINTAPFHPNLLWGVSPSGNIITADSDTYRIRIYSPDLELVNERRNTGVERKITDEDKRDYFDSFRSEETVAWLRRNVEFPEHKPWFDSMFIDSEGYILLCVDERGDDTQVFDVLDPEGNPVGTVELPPLRQAIIADGVIYTTGILDERDFVVYRYRLE